MIQKPSVLEWLCALALAVVSLAGRATGAETVDAEADFRAARAWLGSYSTSLNKGDVDAFAALWAEDADWAPPDAPPLSGRQAILGSVRATLDKCVLTHRYTAQSIKVVDGFGVAKIAATERCTPKGSSRAEWEQGIKGVVILRRAGDGPWTATHFIWNRDAPPAR